MMTEDSELENKGLEQHRSIIIRGALIIKPNTFCFKTEKSFFQSDEKLSNIDIRSYAKRLLTKSEEKASLCSFIYNYIYPE